MFRALTRRVLFSLLFTVSAFAARADDIALLNQVYPSGDIHLFVSEGILVMNQTIDGGVLRRFLRQAANQGYRVIISQGGLNQDRIRAAVQSRRTTGIYIFAHGAYDGSLLFDERYRLENSIFSSDTSPTLAFMMWGACMGECLIQRYTVPSWVTVSRGRGEINMLTNADMFSRYLDQLPAAVERRNQAFGATQEFGQDAPDALLQSAYPKGDIHLLMPPSVFKYGPNIAFNEVTRMTINAARMGYRLLVNYGHAGGAAVQAATSSERTAGIFWLGPTTDDGVLVVDDTQRLPRDIFTSRLHPQSKLALVGLGTRYGDIARRHYYLTSQTYFSYQPYAANLMDVERLFTNYLGQLETRVQQIQAERESAICPAHFQLP